QQQQLIASDGAASDNLGSSVALNSDGTTALVGAMFDDYNGTFNQGSAYTYLPSGGGWTQQRQLGPNEPVSGALFGNAVAINGDGNMALLGAWYDDTGGNFERQGAAYVFDLTAP
ncbi:MAG: FG-GAP repeat protein, partial [Armatimonadetes bacterium]|nr:FG-GAP repeat protein [Anaerolineae bacterium]